MDPRPAEALERLIQMFGHHKEDCAVMQDNATPQTRCTCGLDAQKALVKRHLERPR